MDVVSYVKLKAMETLLNGAVNDTVVIPVDVQNRLQQTIQTHSATTLAPSTSSAGNNVWIDSDGFDRVVVKIKLSAATSTNVEIDWSDDGSVSLITERVIANTTTADLIMELPTRSRWFKVRPYNGGASPITANGSVYLKA